jgi:hypothetical protein
MYRRCPVGLWAQLLCPCTPFFPPPLHLTSGGNVGDTFLPALSIRNPVPASPCPDASGVWAETGCWNSTQTTASPCCGEYQTHTSIPEWFGRLWLSSFAYDINKSPMTGIHQSQ